MGRRAWGRNINPSMTLPVERLPVAGREATKQTRDWIMTNRTMIEGPAAAKRVLIYRMGSLGDTLVALPALHLVARAFPRAERRLLTNIPVNVKAPPAAAILEHTGLVDGYFRYIVGTRSVGELARLWWTLA